MARLKLSSALLGAALGMFGMMLTVPAYAHHSVQAEFDIHKSFTINGTIVKVEWINPHSYITVNVKDASGTSTRYGFELGGGGVLRRAGMSREDRGGLKPGDPVTIKALAAKDGSNNGFLQELTLPDGRVIKFDADQNGN
jgi:Family of unknown function (DUF6152)